jgi:hypothetical protein
MFVDWKSTAYKTSEQGQKRRGIGELLEQEKSIVVPNITILWGYERYWGTAGDALTE